jgi:hypothetical protein
MLLRVPAMSDSLGVLSKPAAARCAGSVDRRLSTDVEVGAALVGVDGRAAPGSRRRGHGPEGKPAAAVDAHDDERIARLDPVDARAALGRVAIVAASRSGALGALPPAADGGTARNRREQRRVEQEAPALRISLPCAGAR